MNAQYPADYRGWLAECLDPNGPAIPVISYEEWKAKQNEKDNLL